MAIFEVEANGKTFEIEAPSWEAAHSAFTIHAPNWSETALDAVKSGGVGLAKGAIHLAGLPGDIRSLVGAATDWAGGKMGFNQADIDKFKTASQANAMRSPFTAPFAVGPTSQDVQNKVEDYTGEFRKPQTVAGEYAQTIGEFAPAAAIGPGGWLARTAQTVVPAVTSETAGQVTKGKPSEPYARFAGALVGGVGTTLASRPGTASRALREQLPEGITQQHMDDAARLIDDAGQRGVTLAWPEALSQVAGRPVLTNLMRHLEASPQSEARMAEFFGQRPRQIENAGRAALDYIAPPNQAPSTIGPAARDAADSAIGGVRQRINDTARPYYQASETVLLTPQEMAQVRALPGYQEARDAVRNNPQLNRYVANLPDDSVGFLNEVKKQLDQQSQNAASRFNQGRNQQVAAGYGNDAAAVRDAAVNATLGNPARNFETALNIESQGRRQFLQPLLDGPLGRIAKKDTTTQRAIEALFPSNPLPNSEREIRTAVSGLVSRNPRAAGDLVRAHTESVFNEATQALQSGANQAGGAKFRAVLVGNPQQRANFEAAVTALPHGQQRLEGFNRFLDIAEATGTRQNIGSRTAYNAELFKGASTSGMIGEGIKATANPLRGLQFLADKYERWRLGGNLNELAAILTDPASVNQLRAIARMPVGSSQAANAALRLALTSGTSRESKPVD